MTAERFKEQVDQSIREIADYYHREFGFSPEEARGQATTTLRMIFQDTCEALSDESELEKNMEIIKAFETPEEMIEFMADKFDQDELAGQIRACAEIRREMLTENLVKELGGKNE